MADELALRTPKRKREESNDQPDHHSTTSAFTFRSPQLNALDEGGPAGGGATPISPRSSRVIHKFKGLHLGDQSGGGVAPVVDHPATIAFNFNHSSFATPPNALAQRLQNPGQGGLNAGRVSEDILGSDVDDSEYVTSKRKKADDVQMTSPVDANLSQAHSSVRNSIEGSNPQAANNGVVTFTGASRRARKRSGTPPLKKGRKKKSYDDSEDENPEVVDPVRAALTWHENEITIYDPDDSDDDGTGVNGVGFKPTPALARLRIQKRRQQMAAYRKREENEARARRSLRRHGNATGLASSATSIKDHKKTTRRVRFLDIETNPVAITG